MLIEKIKSSAEITVFHLRAARAVLKMSFKELSMLSEVSEGALFKIESGDLYSRPDHSSLITIAKVRSVFEENNIEFYRNNIIRLAENKDPFFGIAQ